MFVKDCDKFFVVRSHIIPDQFANLRGFLYRGMAVGFQTRHERGGITNGWKKNF